MAVLSTGMTLPEAVVMLVVGLGLLLTVLQAFAQRALLQAPPPPPPSDLPAVSILKPLKGMDADLRENLRSLFRLRYPDFEIILGTEAPDDAALAVARQVAGEFSGIKTVIVSGSLRVGLNPKVNNLAHLSLRACHPLLLISDSNVRVSPDHLTDLVAHRAQAGGGLVTALVRGVSGSGLGGMLESLQLNGAVMGGLSALSWLLKIPCAVGKSMLLHRADLERIGGFRFLGQFLAEDQICAEELARHGVPVRVTGHPVDNVLGRRAFREFASRHLRWALLRRHVSVGGYLGEILLNPVFLALLAFSAFRSAPVALVAIVTLAMVSLLDASTERRLGLRRPVWLYPLLELALGLVRGVLWFVPLFSRTVNWRGHALALSSRSRIEPRATRDGAAVRRDGRPAGELERATAA